MKHKGLLVFVALVVVLILLLGGAVSSYNGLIAKNEDVKKARQDIDIQLQRRNELIPNLVATVKGYAAHEESVFTAIADARAALNNPGNMSIESVQAADAAMQSALSRLLVVVESYPDLKASQNFVGLQDQLEGTENRIAVARGNYNEAVNRYNMAIRRFPGNLLAGMMELTPASYYEAPAQSQTAPTVDFGA